MLHHILPVGEVSFLNICLPIICDLCEEEGQHNWGVDKIDHPVYLIFLSACFLFCLFGKLT